MKFRTTLLLGGKTATGIEVPEEIVTGLGSSKRPAVRVTLGDYTYRTTIAPMDGKFMIPVSSDVRKEAGVEAGDELEVTVELDTEPRTVEVPGDLAAALAEKPGATAVFDALAFSKRKEFVRQVEDAKTEETRTRRIAGIVAKMGE
ncbi:MAG TPA: YdeI/OmpD-associated family protein [Phototrophicaceae bacterium]|nr:YdeI/OmpD-associated family protein [Phototrophicaceae bacterium]